MYRNENKVKNPAGIACMSCINFKSSMYANQLIAYTSFQYIACYMYAKWEFAYTSPFIF